MNAATLRILIELGLSGEDLLRVAEAMESGADTRSSAAKRQAKYRENKRQSVTSDVTRDVTHPPKENISNPPSDPDGSVATATDPVKDLFDLGVSLLTSQGQTEKQARSIIGKWREGGKRDGEVIAALVDAKHKSISNLVEWMPKRLNGVGFKPTEPVPLWKHLRDQNQAVGANR